MKWWNERWNDEMNNEIMKWWNEQWNDEINKEMMKRTMKW